MKVLYTLANGYLGGAERFVINAVSGHIQSGKISALILFYQDGEAVELARELNLPYIVLKNRFSLSHVPSLYKAVKEIRSLLVANKIDVMHSTMPYTHIVNSLASWNLPCRRSWFQHGPVGGILDKLASLFKVDILFFNSNYLEKLHYQAFPQRWPTEASTVITMPVTIKKIKENYSSQLVFGTAGRISEVKATHRIIENLSQTHLPFKLIIAGDAKTEKDKEYFQTLTSLSRKLPSHQEVIFLGHVKDMENYYQTIDVFIHDSLYPEPFGLVIAEAMAAGLIVFARKGGGPDKFVKNGVTGFLYETNEELIRNLKMLMKSSDLSSIQKIGSAARSSIKNDFNQMITTRELESFYLKNSDVI